MAILLPSLHSQQNALDFKTLGTADLQTYQSALA
jgi:hypothetical protein